MDKRDIKTLIVLGIIFGLIVLIFVFTKDDTAEIKKKSEFYDLTLVENEDIFFSVFNNINKLCEYSLSDSSKLDYISSGIDYNDYKNASLDVSEMYVISRLNLYKYFIKGSIYSNIYNQESKFIRDFYLVLSYDMDNNAFNIEEISKNSYDKKDSEDLEFLSISKNNYNEFLYTSLSDKSRAILYFNDFINKVYNDIDSAYNLISDDTVSNNFITIDKFKNFINSYDSISMKEYSVSDNKIAVKDNYGNEYIFNINSILKYSVNINVSE